MKQKIILSLIVLILIIALTIILISKPQVEDYKMLETEQEQLEFIKRNLISGGPGKDEIPSIDNPQYLTAKESNLDDNEKVFGINYNGFKAAYPQNIMYWHEIVNQEIDGEKIAITYCPLTESIIGYKGMNLGVSGELYNSNLVMYDRASNARIPQILGKAIEGSIQGQELEHIHVYVTTWKKWKKLHPDTLVLSKETGFNRDYNRNPYPGYDDILRVWFPLVAESDDLETKELVLGIEHNNKFLAIQKSGFQEKYPEGLETQLRGKTIKIIYNKDLNILQIENPEIDSFEVYWFAWYAYHPETKLIKTT